MFLKKLCLSLLSLCLLAACNQANSNQNKTPAIQSPDADVAVYIISPTDGATVSSPVRVIFGLKGMGIAPAGVNLENTGHHHLMIDLDKLPDLTSALPASDNLVHFGKGQTETLIELEPGEHSLQLLLGNFVHVPHAEPVLSKKISITVK